MATDEEKEVTAVAEQPPSVTEAEAEEKKPKAPKRKPKQSKAKTASHPPYFQMIKEALLALDEKSGSSPYAIAKFMEEKHKAVLPANFKKILSLQLKNSEARGKLIKIRASYKLSQTGKKEKETTRIAKEEKKIKKPKTTTAATTTTTRTRSSTRKRRSVNRTEVAPKKPTKKVGAKKAKKTSAAKPKQPKSIKSPAAKRTKKVSVTASAS